MVLLFALFALFSISCAGSLVPHPRNQYDFLPTPPLGFGETVVYGDLNERNSHRPIMVFLAAMEDSNYDRGMRFQELADQGSATFLLPTPPRIFVQSRKRRVRAWYDFRGPLRAPRHLPGYDESQRFLCSLLQELQKLNRPLFISGYGQGGALALDLALASQCRLRRPLAGAVCMSGYVISNPPYREDAMSTTRVMMTHSQLDKRIPFGTARYGMEEQLKKEHGLKKGKFLIFENTHGHGHVFNDESIQLLVHFMEGKEGP